MRTTKSQLAAYLAAIVESSEDAIIGKSIDSLITSWNKGAETLFGYTRDEVLGKAITVLIPEDRLNEEVEIMRKLRRGEVVEHFETVRRRKDGKLIDVSVTISPIRAEDGSVIGASKVARDITGRKDSARKLEALAQSLAEKNKELEAIVYIASHDLRSPLVNIQGFTQELRADCEILSNWLHADGKQAVPPHVQRVLLEDIPESLDFVQAGVVKIDALLGGFLRYSRLGRAAMRSERLDMNAMIDSIIQAQAFQAQQAGMTVQARGPLPPCFGDSVMVNQVFSNLLDNAAKYRSPKRAGVVHISAVREGKQVVYRVADNGIGIALEHQPKIFEIFHRLNPSDSEGEGLGLTIAQKIVERHNGKIWVESRVDEGSTFFVSLPAAEE
jgi:PAS domain S-box-containing protein